MTNRFKARTTVLVAAVAAMLAAVPAATGSDYIHEDARLRGKEIHSFVDGGEKVSVVLGAFSLRLGKHAVTGRDGVLWIRSRSTGGGLSLHDIQVYVEGSAKVVEPGGVSTTDRVMFVTVRSLGRLTADGTMSDRPLKNFPLYRRALAARKEALRGPAAGAESRPAPRLVVSTQPAPKSPIRVTRPGKPAIRVVKPPAPRPVDPVHFHARRVSSEEVGTGDAKRRITIARGDVYLSQGNPDSELYLELRAQAAVVFSARKTGKTEDSGVPWAPKVRGIQAPGGGEQVVTGVYLQGDVVIARGERYLRGPASYYDFTTHRAIMVNPVFRTVQTQRNVPVFIRAEEARVLSERELTFRNAKVSTSDFYTPSYHIGARRVYVKNTTPYDRKGIRLGEHSWLTEMKDATFNVRGVPVGYLPQSRSSIMEGHTPLRRATIGSHGRMGFGGETQWHLFRLLGLVEPEGFDATLDLNWYDRGPFIGVDLEYDRETYHGYSMLYGFLDRDENDDFGEERKNILSPEQRGRVLVRHKQYLPKNWELQFELSYLCDENYLEQFFPDEAYAGKEQETLIYAKQQRDNWAFETLLKYRLNRFQRDVDSLPELATHLIGESLLGDRLTFFHEAHAGLKRIRLPRGTFKEGGAEELFGLPGFGYDLDEDTRYFARLDTRNEINLPLHLGPVNLVPYATGRATYWGDTHGYYGMSKSQREQLSEYENCRVYGQVGARANMHFWRLYPDVQSRLWDLHGMKHVITPEVVAFLGAANAQPEDLYLYSMDPDIEEHLRDQSGAAVGVSQRLQTKRGIGENRRTIDWMRIDAILGIYDNENDLQPADGRFFFYRPEYSLGRNHLNLDYTWNISDSTTLLADGNIDLNTGRMRRWNLGLAVARDPRLRYYLGVRTITDLDSAIATAGFTYKINRKYSLSFLQQIDLDYDGHESMASSLTLLRKFPRWYVGITAVMDHRTDDMGIYLTLWPEGAPEARIGSGRTTLLSQSDLN